MLSIVAPAAATLAVVMTPVAAQTAASGQTPAPTQAPAPAPAKHKPNNYGSPLETIMSTHLWTNVPDAQGFVRDTRPSAKTLDYTPLTGKDPDRPKPRDAANVMALQAELEEDGARNATRGRALQPVAATKAKHAHKRAASGE